MIDHPKTLPPPRAMLERRIRHQFGLSETLARFIAEQLEPREN